MSFSLEKIFNIIWIIRKRGAPPMALLRESLYHNIKQWLLKRPCGWRLCFWGRCAWLCLSGNLRRLWNPYLCKPSKGSELYSPIVDFLKNLLVRFLILVFVRISSVLSLCLFVPVRFRCVCLTVFECIDYRKRNLSSFRIRKNVGWFFLFYGDSAK